MRTPIIFILLFWCMTMAAADWYVRPCVWTNHSGSYPSHPYSKAGVYGTQTGTNYANAWNGLQDVVWGSPGVTAGDTLWVCGTHLYSVTNFNHFPYYQAYIWISNSASGCTIRGDYPSDPGQLFGGAFDWSYTRTWEGPDANGVYRTTNRYNANYNFPFEVVGTNITRLVQTNVETWAGGLGMWSRIGQSNYVKTTTGGSPNDVIAFDADGWRLALPSDLSNVTFVACRFVASSLVIDGYTYPAGPVALNSRAHHLTFRNCVWTEHASPNVTDSLLIGPEPGNDYWTFDGCELFNGKAGIYTGLGNQDSTNQTRGIVNLIVTNCYIHDIDVGNYSNVDGHAIGIRATSDSTYINNRTERTGSAIALYTGSITLMSNNLVAGNFIKDVHWHNETNTTTTGSGIWLSAQEHVAPSNRVINNVIINCGLPGYGPFSTSFGAGINSSLPDYIEIDNNTISNANYGIFITVNSYPPDARIVNNIIVNPTNYVVRCGNQPGSAVICDYNLVWTNIPPASPWYFSGGETHDTHSLFGDPKFVSGADFRLQPASPAIGTAIPLNGVFTTDYAGTVRGAVWDIGAFEYVRPASASVLGGAIFNGATFQ